MPRVGLTTLGCKVNQYETEMIEGLFTQRGYHIVDFEQLADVYVINTCSVTHLGEKKSRQLIRRAVRRNPEAIIVVTGCYAQLSPEQVEAIPGVDIIIGTQKRQQIVDLVEKAKKVNPVNIVRNIMENDVFEDIPLFAVPGRTRAFLKIQEGCTNFCTYCIIPYARGPLRSRPLASITAETAKLVAAGFKEIVLTGIHLGAYGRDCSAEITLTDAVKTVLDIPGIVRLRLSSLESIEVSEDLIDLMANDHRLCPHLHLPLQSGDDHILQQMNRHYSVAKYRILIEKIRSRITDVAITTDVIVGFPGETDQMFENTLRAVADIGFANVHIFPYSRRTGTPAAQFADQIAEEVKKDRITELQAVVCKQSELFRMRLLNRDLEVLFESDKDGIKSGLTGNYVKIYTDSDNPQILGQVGTLHTEKLYLDGLWGN